MKSVTKFILTPLIPVSFHKYTIKTVYLCFDKAVRGPGALLKIIQLTNVSVENCLSTDSACGLVPRSWYLRN